MRKMVIRNYRTYEVIKKVPIKTYSSIQYQVERSKNGKRWLVIRDYRTNDVVQRISVPEVSIQFNVE